MLKSLIDAANELHKPIVSSETLTEYKLPNSMAQVLKSRLKLSGLSIEAHTSSLKTSETNFAVIPNQFFSFACYFFDFANVLIKYFQLLGRFQERCSEKHIDAAETLFGEWEAIKEKIESNEELKSCFESYDDIELFCRFLDQKDKSYRLGAKSPINNNNGFSIRGHDDCFGSVVLTQINLPNASSSIFGDLVYALANAPDVFVKLKEHHIHFAGQQDAILTISLEKFREQSHADFIQAGLRVSDGLLLRFSAALLAKRFLILTGLSGSGKTKLAHAFASWLTESRDQCRLVAVGADWTTNENVVGYQDALQPEIYRKPSNGLLEVILRAAANTDHPYFLILDEMNLSHVERYFADILSAIESRQEIALHASAESLKSSEHDTLLVPSKISLPNNLFIIGTVNVDETTYMFSPKVLDRANVIEFRATAEDIAAFLDNPSAVDMELLEGKGAAFGAAFVAEAAAEVQLKSATAAELKARLAEVFAALAPIGAEFGFRTAYEITRFTYYHEQLTGAGWQFNDALDAQVLQKLMPKLHGSQRRLEPVLKALEKFCTDHQCNVSLEKIKRMQDRLKDGFTSFAEA